MTPGRTGRAILTLALLSCVATACSTSNRTSSSTGNSPPSRTITALGDSVPRGANCDCSPYPQLSADGLTASTGDTVTAHNDAVGGATTSSVLGQLQSDAKVIDHVRAADTVEIEVGANDVAHSRSCGTNVACYEPRLPALRKNLAAIVTRVHELAAGHKVLVVLLDYWSVWLGGQYAAAQGEAYVAAAEHVTDEVNTIIKETAATRRLSLRRPARRLQRTGLRLRRNSLSLERRRPPQRGRAQADRGGHRSRDRRRPPHLTTCRCARSARSGNRQESLHLATHSLR